MRGFLKFRIAAVLGLLAVALTACAAGNAAQQQQPRLAAANSVNSTNTVYCHPGPASPAERAAESVADQFVARSNAWDTAGISASLADSILWDSVGTVYSGRTAVMQQLIIPAVIKTHGHYTTLAVTWDGYRLQVDYHFTSAAGDNVKLHYAYLIQNGVIQNLVEYLD